MGRALFQSMKRSEDDININEKPKEIKEVPKRKAIMPPQQVQSGMAAQSENCLSPVSVQPQVIFEDRSSLDKVPLESNFEDDGISDLDLSHTICDVSEENRNESKSSSTMVSNTSNILTTIPKAMFANYQIGSINITIARK